MKYRASKGAAGDSACSTSATKNRNKRGRQGGGNAVGDEDQPAAAESRSRQTPGAGWAAAAHCRRQPGTGTDPGEKVVSGGDQQQRRQHPAQAGDAFVISAGQQGRQGGGEHDAEQAETFAGGRQPGALAESTPISAPQA
jgi:hypothetical protein